MKNRTILVIYIRSLDNQTSFHFLPQFRAYLIRRNMKGDPAERPLQPRGKGVDDDLEVAHTRIRLRFRCTTGVVAILGVTSCTIGTIFGKEKIKPVIESICNFVFGKCKVTTEGSVVVDVDCSTAKRANDLISDYKCGKLKRRFLEELLKIDATAEEIRIKFDAKATLKLNENWRLR